MAMQEPNRKAPTTSSIDHPKYLFVKECADILRLSYKGMWSIIASGNGPPYVKPNKYLRIPEDKFYEWINTRTK
jgi:hypothetical protein